MYLIILVAKKADILVAKAFHNFIYLLQNSLNSSHIFTIIYFELLSLYCFCLHEQNNVSKKDLPLSCHIFNKLYTQNTFLHSSFTILFNACEQDLYFNNLDLYVTWPYNLDLFETLTLILQLSQGSMIRILFKPSRSRLARTSVFQSPLLESQPQNQNGRSN